MSILAEPEALAHWLADAQALAQCLDYALAAHDQVALASSERVWEAYVGDDGAAWVRSIVESRTPDGAPTGALVIYASPADQVPAEEFPLYDLGEAAADAQFNGYACGVREERASTARYLNRVAAKLAEHGSDDPDKAVAALRRAARWSADAEDADDEAVARLSDTLAEYLGDDHAAGHLAVAIVDDYVVAERMFPRVRSTS